jgi:hypothetical protein
MVPISGRIEDDLYQWFISLDYPGARSNSDKLREAMKELRRQQEAGSDLVKAQAWMQSMTGPLRQSLALIDRDEHAHSDVFTILLEHVLAMAATVVATVPANAADAARMEEQLVRRSFALTEALLRQALAPSAVAFDPEVVRRHSKRIVEISTLINSSKQGEDNG